MMKKACRTIETPTAMLTPSRRRASSTTRSILSSNLSIQGRPGKFSSRFRVLNCRPRHVRRERRCSTAAPPPPPPRSTTPAFDFIQPFAFTFQDERWLQKVLIGGLFYIAAFFLVGVFFIMGYC